MKKSTIDPAQLPAITNIDLHFASFRSSCAMIIVRESLRVNITTTLMKIPAKYVKIHLSKAVVVKVITNIVIPYKQAPAQPHRSNAPTYW